MTEQAYFSQEVKRAKIIKDFPNSEDIDEITAEADITFSLIQELLGGFEQGGLFIKKKILDTEISWSS